MSENFDFTLYNNIKRVSEEKLEKLWMVYLRDKSNKDARDKLIVQYIYLIKYVVGRIRVNLPVDILAEDIAGYGVEGLINAIERFSIDKNTKFETYALIRIRGTIMDRLRSEDFLPRSVRAKLKKLKQVQEDLKQELGRMPTTKELAVALDMDEEKVTQLLSEDVTVSSIYDKQGASEDSLEVIDTIQDENSQSPAEKAEESNVKQQLENALKRLPERERNIMVLYYQENMTLKEIGQVLGMSESRVCQLHAQSIVKLKNILNEKRSQRLQKNIIG